MNVEYVFQSALEYHLAREFHRAEELCKEILKVHPNHIPALHLYGVTLCQLGKHNSAIEYIEKALRLNPNNPDAYNHLGTALKAKGLIDEAMRSYLKAIELNPDLADAYFNLANALIARGQIDKAIMNYQKAVGLNPNFFAAYFNLGKAFQDKGNSGEAIVSYKMALEVNPDSADTCDALGLLHQEKGQPDEAIIYFKKAITINPGIAGVYGNLGKALHEMGHLDEAINYYKKALQLNADPSVLSNLYNNTGAIYQEKGHFDEALAFYKRALGLAPERAEIYKNIGTVLHDTGDFDAATDYYQKGLELNPDDAEIYCNLGGVSEDKGMIDEALMFYQKALLINPDLAEAHWNISLAQLKSGAFEEGWRNYEWRLLKKDAKPSFFTQPRWEGSPLKGKILLVTSEQGVGDEIMFASCLPDLMDKVDLCIIECDKRLVSLFERSFTGAKFFERRAAGKLEPLHHPEAEMKIEIGSLPTFFRPSLHSFSQQKAYLFPDAGKVKIWKERYSELASGLNIGISWRGGSKPSVKLARSTFLNQWKDLFSVRGVRFINLQYGDCKNELKEALEKTGVTIHHWEDSDPLKDLDNFAAQIAAIDLVISVDNATVHMAGALGIPVWTLLPFACDWRWMLDYEDTPWYKTVRLFRQKRHGDWEEVFERVASNLRQYISTGVLPEIDFKKSYKYLIANNLQN